MSADRSPRPARHDRESVLDAAMAILDSYGLADLTMRRLAAALDLQPSALYWHFPNKQALLAGVADRIIAGARPVPRAEDWHDAVAAEARSLRDALLAYRDGAEVVLSTQALGLGSDLALTRLRDSLAETGSAEIAATVLLQYTLGHASLVQQRLQADSVGALPADAETAALAADTTFDGGLRMIVAGIDAADATSRMPPGSRRSA